MPNPDNSKIPEEILLSEQRQDHPVRSDTPGVLGLPGLPEDIINLVLRYGPVLVLAAAAYTGFGVVAMFIGLSSLDSSQPRGPIVLGGMLSLAAALAIAISYIWLVQKRRIGWNTLALGLIGLFIGQAITAGVGSLLFSGVEILITAYVMLQIRDYYSKE